MRKTLKEKRAELPNLKNETDSLQGEKIPLHKRRKLEFVELMFARWRIPSFDEEYQFDPNRRWKFDYAFPDFKIAVEFEGGSFIGGRHTRGSGFQKDAEKYNTAASKGWLILKATTATLMDDDFLVLLFDALVYKKAIHLPVEGLSHVVENTGIYQGVER